MDVDRADHAVACVIEVGSGVVPVNVDIVFGQGCFIGPVVET